MAGVLKGGAFLLFCKTSSFRSTRSNGKGGNGTLSDRLLLRKASGRSSVYVSPYRNFFRSSLKATDADGRPTACPPLTPSISTVDSTASAPLSNSVPEAGFALESPSSSAFLSSDPIKDLADALDIRVGRILRAWRHPEADSLYVEEVDIGETEPRTICSGLVNYIPLEDLQDIQVVVLANLKPRNMRGVKSSGMLLAVSNASHENVELLLPPEGSVPGERVWFGSKEEKETQLAAATPTQVQKKKIWEAVQPHLMTDDSCVAALGVHPMQTSAGVVVCRSLKNANIS